MTFQQVNLMIESFGLPYAYYQFPEGTDQPCPFICFFYSGSGDVYADDINYQDIRKLTIELYTSTRDLTLEAVIEEFLKDNGFSYYREPNYIDTEKMWQIAYEMEVMINGKQS